MPVLFQWNDLKRWLNLSLKKKKTFNLERDSKQWPLFRMQWNSWTILRILSAWEIQPARRNVRLSSRDLQLQPNSNNFWSKSGKARVIYGRLSLFIWVCNYILTNETKDIPSNPEKKLGLRGHEAKNHISLCYIIRYILMRLRILYFNLEL